MIAKECPVCKRRGSYGNKFQKLGFIPMALTVCDDCDAVMCGSCWLKHIEKEHGINTKEDRGTPIPRSWYMFESGVIH